MSNVTYGQLRDLLTGLGFEEVRRAEGVALKHLASDTVFLFRPYRENDPVKPVEVQHVRLTLDTRELLGTDAFDGLMTKAPHELPTLMEEWPKCSNRWSIRCATRASLEIPRDAG